jgi:hypothetical protein
MHCDHDWQQLATFQTQACPGSEWAMLAGILALTWPADFQLEVVEVFWYPACQVNVMIKTFADQSSANGKFLPTCSTFC